MTITTLYCGNNINCILDEYLIQFLSMSLVLFLILLNTLFYYFVKKIKKLQNKN